jgi:hypothetical protein
MIAEDKIKGSVANHKPFKIPPQKNVNILPNPHPQHKVFSMTVQFLYRHAFFIWRHTQSYGTLHYPGKIPGMLFERNGNAQSR